jgi:hypothetical protein
MESFAGSMAICTRVIGAKGGCKGTGSTPTACTVHTRETGKSRAAHAPPTRRLLMVVAHMQPVLAHTSCDPFPTRVLPTPSWARHAPSLLLEGACLCVAVRPSPRCAAVADTGDASHRYEGGYFRGQRQGSGVYRYAGKGGGVYLGEWLNGQMDGHGMMMYPDGEFYVGTWRRDKKEGLGVRPNPHPSSAATRWMRRTRGGLGRWRGAGLAGQVYIWGQSSGGASGDRYEGQFLDGLSHGLGRTLFSAGGSHRVRPARCCATSRVPVRPW